MDIDVSEFRTLAADLGKASGAVFRLADEVTERAALNIKTDMVAYAKWSVGGGRAKHFPTSITYDRAFKVGQIAYEIGPDKGRRQGALGNLLYFGSSNNGAVLDIEVGINDEAPKFERRMADMAEGLLDG